MEITPTFARAFFVESLRVPWIIGPTLSPLPVSTPDYSCVPAPAAAPLPLVEDEVSCVLTRPFILVTGDLAPAPVLSKMLERMIVAIRQDGESLQAVAVPEKGAVKKILGNLKLGQKVLVFGPARWPDKNVEMGHWLTTPAGAQVMLTYDLLDLKANPALKKYTWDHLQKFAGIK